MFRRAHTVIRTLSLALALLALTLVVVDGATTARPGVDWPSFRGIGAAGVADGKTTLTAWDMKAGEPVSGGRPRFPGSATRARSSWGNQVCVATATSAGGEESLKVGLYGDIAPVEDRTGTVWKVVCFDKPTGKMRWERSCTSGVPEIKRHPKSTHANSTLATDGTHIVAFFGSEGLYAYRHEGQAALEEGLRRARFRLLHGAGRAMGIRQLAGDSRRPRHRAGRRAEGIVRRGVRRARPARSSGGRRAPTCRPGARRRCR